MSCAQPNEFGEMLRSWRQARHLSQLDLALQAEVSSRHISFIETGRSSPSREMVLLLASALGVPLRDRNTLLQAAGYAPAYRETRLDDPQMAEILRALRLILQQHGPMGGAVALDRRWDVIMANGNYVRFTDLLLGERGRIEPFVLTAPPRLNALRMLFDPGGFRPHIANWEVVARALLARARREAAWSQDPVLRELLENVLAFPGVPTDWREPELEATMAMVIPLELRVPQGTLRLFSTITTLGTPQDITLQELRIESFHAADSESERLVCSALGLG
jgi:transcriptional regulator with XRE-family HTH domain